ncbi:helix-turn-helix domain-containing protein [Mesorhizobium caraganae]|uniref:helix-turn-helix domain-containing protein n=1 Tax=Mesorhizobium caraganae TaxID=483206 RepID=UPI0035E45B87
MASPRLRREICWPVCGRATLNPLFPLPPALALVAEGKTDWEISVILGIAQATVRFHVDNARRKLSAVNRTQAVARLVKGHIGRDQPGPCNKKGRFPAAFR